MRWLSRLQPSIEAASSVVSGAVWSMRIAVDAVCTGSALPKPSTEKYLIVCTPSVVRAMDVPVGESVSGVDPSVVKWVAATPEPTSVASSSTVAGLLRHAFVMVAVLSVVTGTATSTWKPTVALTPVLPAASVWDAVAA